MTNAQKWIAAFLALFVLLFLLSKLTDTTEDDFESIDFYDEEIQEDESSAFALINKTNCTSCHGTDLRGASLGPTLYNLSEYWDRDGLINYLRNPSSYSGDARFEEYNEKYSDIIMPAYGNIDVKDLGRMADYILSLKE
jgi:hypothetical protein